MKFRQPDIDALNSTAADLKIPVAWLVALINFETAGTFDPLVKNPLSSARGLIQFTNATASRLGYRDSLELVTRNPSISSQLRGPVLQYLKPMGPFRDKQDFVFSVFLPKYRTAPLSAKIVFQDALQQSNFSKSNPGIVTVGDYFAKLERAFERASGKFPAAIGAGIVAILLLGGIVWVITKG